MIGMIAAVSANGVIGLDNKLPFDYPADMKHFRTTTAGSTVIMGRKTWEGIGRLLPKRRNIVVSRNKIEIDGLETFASMQKAILAATKPEGSVPIAPPANASSVMTPRPDVWLIGGASIYEEGMEYANKIVLTLTPDIIMADNGSTAIRFPWINPNKFVLESNKPLLPEDDSCKLRLATYIRI